MQDSNTTQQKKILIVDNTRALQHRLGRLLGKMGYISVDIASNNKTAFEKLADKSYDIIFLDIDLADNKGSQMLNQITEQYRHSKVIMCANDNSLENVRQTWEMGAKGFIAKPFNEQNVKNAVRRLQFN